MRQEYRKAVPVAAILISFVTNGVMSLFKAILVKMVYQRPFFYFFFEGSTLVSKIFLKLESLKN